jgi:hypothetical protein
VSEELEVLRIVTERLAAAGMAYMVTGSMALGVYAVPRMTRDIDLVVELSADDADRVCALFAADFYVDADAVRTSIAHRGTFHLIHEVCSSSKSTSSCERTRTIASPSLRGDAG